jgi:hypothetical protein
LLLLSIEGCESFLIKNIRINIHFIRCFMKFTRILKPQFIAALNELYKDKNSWWRTIVDDKDVFILIRNNQLRAQVSGGLLLEIRHKARRKLICRMSDLFLTLHSGTVRYVEIDETTTAPTQRIEGLRGLVKLFENREIRAKETETPKVAGQLQKYEKLLAQYGPNIVAGYNEQLHIYSQLEGKFFKSRMRNFAEINLYPQARLIITGFDGPQRDIMLPVVQKGICQRIQVA